MPSTVLPTGSDVFAPNESADSYRTSVTSRLSNSEKVERAISIALHSATSIQDLFAAGRSSWGDIGSHLAVDMLKYISTVETDAVDRLMEFGDQYVSSLDPTYAPEPVKKQLDVRLHGNEDAARKRQLSGRLEAAFYILVGVLVDEEREQAEREANEQSLRQKIEKLEFELDRLRHDNVVLLLLAGNRHEEAKRLARQLERLQSLLDDQKRTDWLDANTIGLIANTIVMIIATAVSFTGTAAPEPVQSVRSAAISVRVECNVPALPDQVHEEAELLTGSFEGGYEAYESSSNDELN